MKTNANSQHSDISKASALMRDYLILCKPKVVLLMLVTAVVGMYLASSDGKLPLPLVLFTILGIGCCASAGAVINHIIDCHIDKLMGRTARRPIATGKISVFQGAIFSIILTVIGLEILSAFVNGLTAWLSLATLLGYAGIYTIYLKRATPQNIVIGGLSGAFPPLLGWVAVTGHIDPQSLILVLIIFTWTPPHFWALAIYRIDEYKIAKIPMLPVTHGIAFTKLCILLYTVLLTVVTVLPFVLGMSGGFYLLNAILLDVIFLYWAIRLYSTNKPIVAMQTFRYSISYLFLIFMFLLIDHYVF